MTYIFYQTFLAYTATSIKRTVPSINLEAEFTILTKSNETADEI